MKKKGNIVSYTSEEMRALPSQTDWAKVNSMTEEEIERLIADDPDEQAFMDPAYVSGPYAFNPADGITLEQFHRDIEKKHAEELVKRAAQTKPPSQSVQVELDADIVAALKKAGRGYKQKINQILRDYLNEHPELSQDQSKAA